MNEMARSYLDLWPALSLLGIRRGAKRILSTTRLGALHADRGLFARRCTILRVARAFADAAVQRGSNQLPRKVLRSNLISTRYQYLQNRLEWRDHSTACVWTMNGRVAWVEFMCRREQRIALLKRKIGPAMLTYQCRVTGCHLRVTRKRARPCSALRWSLSCDKASGWKSGCPFSFSAVSEKIPHPSAVNGSHRWKRLWRNTEQNKLLPFRNPYAVWTNP